MTSSARRYRFLELRLGLVQEAELSSLVRSNRIMFRLPLTRICHCLQRPQAQAHSQHALDPRINGKAERFFQPLCKEWVFVMPIQNFVERNLWFPGIRDL